MRLILAVKKQFPEYILDSDNEYEDWFETDLHKEIAASIKPGDYLRNYREVQGMTQKDLAEKIRIRVNYLSDMETGQRPISRIMAKKLCKIFNVSAGVFI